MPMHRYEKYLETYHMYSNCIQFRIQSSKAIEKWKNVQAFQLNQIANGKFYFEKDRKEILLLKYELWTRFIFEVENYIIELMNEHEKEVHNNIDSNELNSIISLAEKTCDVYEDVILNRFPQHFNELFSEIWIKTHRKSNELMISQFMSLVNLSYDKFFIRIVEILSKMLHYTLIEIHELNGFFSHFIDTKNTLAKNEPPFMIATPIDMYAKMFGFENLTIQRYNVYKEYFDIKELYFKNYGEQRIPREVFDTIEKDGIDIRYKLNF